MFQTEGTASAKSLMQVFTWGIWRGQYSLTKVSRERVVGN